MAFVFGDWEIGVIGTGAVIQQPKSAQDDAKTNLIPYKKYLVSIRYYLAFYIRTAEYGSTISQSVSVRPSEEPKNRQFQRLLTYLLVPGMRRGYNTLWLP